MCHTWVYWCLFRLSVCRTWSPLALITTLKWEPRPNSRSPTSTTSSLALFRWVLLTVVFTDLTYVWVLWLCSGRFCLRLSLLSWCTFEFSGFVSVGSAYGCPYWVDVRLSSLALFRWVLLTVVFTELMYIWVVWLCSVGSAYGCLYWADVRLPCCWWKSRVVITKHCTSLFVGLVGHFRLTREL